VDYAFRPLAFLKGYGKGLVYHGDLFRVDTENAIKSHRFCLLYGGSEVWDIGNLSDGARQTNGLKAGGAGSKDQLLTRGEEVFRGWRKAACGGKIFGAQSQG